MGDVDQSISTGAASSGRRTAANAPSISSGHNGTTRQLFAEHPPRLDGQLPIAPHQRRQAAVEQSFQEVDRLAHAEPRRGVVGPRPVEFVVQLRAARAGHVVSMANRGRMLSCLPVATHVEEARPLRSAKPLVAVARVVGRPKPRQVQRHHSGGVCAVDEGVDAARVQAADDFLDRQDYGRGTGNVVDDSQPRPLGHGRQNRLDHLVRRLDRRRQASCHDLGPRLRGRQLRGAETGVVSVIGQQQLVARLQPQRPQHAVDSLGGVAHKHQIFGFGPDRCGQRLPRGVEQRRHFATEEPHGLPLHLPAELLLHVEYRPGAGPEGTVIEKGHLAIEVP